MLEDRAQGFVLRQRSLNAALNVALNRTLTVLPPVFGLLTATTAAAWCAPADWPVRGSPVDHYFDLLDERVRVQWADASYRLGVPDDALRTGRVVVSFRLGRQGMVDRVKLKHVALESVLPVHRSRSAEAGHLLDVALVRAVSRLLLPPPPREFQCPRKMIVVFDPQRYHAVKVMFDMEAQRLTLLKRWM